MKNLTKKLGLCLTLAVGLSVATTAMAQEKQYRFTILTQTGVDNTFWQTIKRGMDDACATYRLIANCYSIRKTAIFNNICKTSKQLSPRALTALVR
jgi:ABC-type sugar transport system substrate-binding protein